MQYDTVHMNSISDYILRLNILNMNVNGFSVDRAPCY